MTTVFLKVISDILQQHEELLRKYKQKTLKLKEYDGIFLKARTTGGRTYFTGHRPPARQEAEIYRKREAHYSTTNSESSRNKSSDFDARKQHRCAQAFSG